ncbi:MAG: peptidase S8 [Polyangiaceae bacterium]|nr:peptidase S8 [Polyangiaceae bacterium]
MRRASVKKREGPGDARCHEPGGRYPSSMAISRSAPLAAIAALALGAAVLAPSGASADELPPPPTAEQSSTTSWDIPGFVVIDAKDDLSDGEIADLLGDVSSKIRGASFSESDLEDETRIEIARVSADDVDDVIDLLDDDARIEHVEPLSWVHTNFVPNDPLYEKQWHMQRVGAPAAWDYGTGRGVTVAVIDTGIACEDHEGFRKGTDLEGTRCVPGWNFIWDNEHANDDHGHGTHVAGTVAQSTDNGIGATGLAFHVRLMPIKVLDKGGWGTTVDIANGIRWASDHGAHVINLSLGGPRNAKVMEDAIAHARSQGTIVVAAAGNSGGSVGFPGGSEGVIGVSATDQNDKLASFSSRGKGVDIAAPGVDVVQQTICDGGKNKCEQFPNWRGTSMASPHVAAAAAMVVGMGVTDPDAVERILSEHARVVDPSEGGRRLYGAGILDVEATLKAIHFKQAFVRLGLVAAFSAIVMFMMAAAKRKNVRLLSPQFLIGALATGPGLFFFLPLFLSRTQLPVDVLSRPFADLDFYIGASVHRLLPLATAIVPLALLVTTFQWKRARPFVAGVGVGTAAYLASVVLLGQAYAPFGTVALVVWCALNGIASLFIARTCLAETE